MSDTAIKIENITKQFVLPHQRSNTLKSFFVNPFQRFDNERQTAFEDISFEVKKGEFFGIVGRNGSGKSTLLKCIAGVYMPDAGKIRVNGKLVPFIELGVGFNPELSGRDNVFLNGALLGFNRREITAMYDKIVEFSELERFMDQKLKNYSSGMQVRLAFSIAIQSKGDVLLLDEVLAVGDTAFQKKCFDYFANLKRTKKTVILVTHDMSAIERYCDKALFLKNGRIESIGSPEEISYLYMLDNLTSYTDGEFELEKQMRQQKGPELKILNKRGDETKLFSAGDELTVRVSWEDPNIKNIGVALLTDSGEYVFGTNTDIDKFKITGKKLEYKLKLDIGDGKYMFKAGFYGKTDQDKLDFMNNGPSFSVATKNKGRWGGLVSLEHEWKNNA